MTDHPEKSFFEKENPDDLSIIEEERVCGELRRLRLFNVVCGRSCPVL
jgi:hypothetical protein